MAEAGIIIATAIASVLLMDWLARGVRDFFEAETPGSNDGRGSGQAGARGLDTHSQTISPRTGREAQ